MGKSVTINALLNVVRQGMSIIFPLITFPYVSRILGNIEFGRYSFSASIISYFVLLSTFGINIYAVREGSRIRNNRQKIEKMVSDLFTINIFTTLIAITLLILLVLLNGKVYDYRELICIQSLSIILTAIGVDWINTIYEDYLYITIRYIIIQVIALIAIIVFVDSPQDVSIYCLILTFASYGGNIVNLIYVRKYIKLKINFQVNIKKYFMPLAFLFINSLAIVIYVNSDITMLGLYTSDREVGVYSFSSKIYNMIKYLINAALLVTVPRLAYILARNIVNYKKRIDQVTNVMIMIIFPCATMIFLLSKSIIIVVGGEAYLQGVYTLQILSVSLIFALLASITSNCILILNRKEKRCLVGTTTSAICNVVLNILLIPIIGIEAAAITTVLAELINMKIQIFFVKKDLDIKLYVDRFILFFTMIIVMIVVAAFIFFKTVIPGETIGDSLEIIVGVCFSTICAFLVSLYFFRNKLMLVIDGNDTGEKV